MTQEELEAIERQFDKAKIGGSGPQALADWAAANAPALFAAARAGVNDGALSSEMQELMALYPDVPIEQLMKHAVLQLKLAEGPVISNGKRVRQSVRELVERYVAGLRPFAALGSPPALNELDRLRAQCGAAEDVPAFAVADDDGVLVASVSREQCIEAHELVNDYDGGEGR